MTSTFWLALAAVVLAVAGLVLGIVIYRRQQAMLAQRSAAAPEPVASEHSDDTLVAFVANPSKPDVVALRSQVRRICAEHYLREPLWLETTTDDPGVGQTKDALEKGAGLVVALGGDGTVRAVAEGLAGSGVPMGLMPMGTGNLLARNLDLPLSDPEAALQIALDGRDRTIDVGRLRVLRWESDIDDPVAEATDDLPDDTDLPRDHIFLVIAGVGFDAAMVADTDEQLKAKVGWIAYFVAGIKHLHGRRIPVRLTLDGGEPRSTKLRTVLIGNCGRLPGGLTILPDAELDDGWLDIGTIDTRGGLAGWVQLFGEVVMQGLGLRNDLPAKIGHIDLHRAREVRVEIEGGEHVQVDGDIVGRANRVAARVDPGALVVRVP